MRAGMRDSSHEERRDLRHEMVAYSQPLMLAASQSFIDSRSSSRSHTSPPQIIA